MRRRSFLGTIVASAGGVLSACGGAGDGGGANDGSRGAPLSPFFPQSVASGDPKPSSVVLWARVVDTDTDADLRVQLEVALDIDFQERIQFDEETSLVVTARGDADGCVKIRVEDLEPDQRYFYRFVYEKDGTRHLSPTGRTKTAPSRDADRDVRFAVMSCQDYSGRYYHAHRLASDLPLDFVLFLGDYIYETADDPSFQASEPERSIIFDDEEGARVVATLPPGGGLLATASDSDLPDTAVSDGSASEEQAGVRFLAARSLDNYRQLYRTYRSDPDLQRLHESFPMIAIPDDHEFSNDCHGATATYTAGREDELDLEGRANSDQAWFEYMPVDYPDDSDLEFDPDAAFPDSLRLYRDFEFGAHLHLVVTDLRRYRTDHVVPEEALPGAIAVSEPQLIELGSAIPDWAVAYVDIDEYVDGAYQAAVVAALEAQAKPAWDAEQIRGNVSVPFINRLVQELQLDLEPLDEDDDSLARGVSYQLVGKTEQYSSSGSRYFLGHDAFDLVAAQRFAETGGASEQLLGEEQQAWFFETLESSAKTWKVWGNEYTLMKRRADLRELDVPDELKGEFTISAEDWDGAPNQRRTLVDALTNIDNLVVVSGDLHSFLVGNIGVPGGERLVEFVAGAISSATYQAILTQSGSGLESIAALPGFAGAVLRNSNPHLAYQNLASNGFAVVLASESRLDVTLHRIDFEKVRQPDLNGDLSDHFDRTVFQLEADSPGVIYRVTDDLRERWNAEAGEWEDVTES